MQVNVEANEIDLGRLKKFCRRKRSKREEASGINRLGFINQAIDESFDSRHSAPAHDFGGDFIDDAEGEHGTMSFAGPDSGLDSSARLLLRLLRVQEAEVLCPRNVDQHSEPMFLR